MNSSGILYVVSCPVARMKEARMRRWTSLEREMYATGFRKFFQESRSYLKILGPRKLI